jgi:hypothetical protein
LRTHDIWGWRTDKERLKNGAPLLGTVRWIESGVWSTCDPTHANGPSGPFAWPICFPGCSATGRTPVWKFRKESGFTNGTSRIILGMSPYGRFLQIGQSRLFCMSICWTVSNVLTRIFVNLIVSSRSTLRRSIRPFEGHLAFSVTVFTSCMSQVPCAYHAMCPICFVLVELVPGSTFSKYYSSTTRHFWMLSATYCFVLHVSRCRPGSVYVTNLVWENLRVLYHKRHKHNVTLVDFPDRCLVPRDTLRRSKIPLWWQQYLHA